MFLINTYYIVQVVFCTVGDKAHTVIVTRSLKFKPSMPNLIWKPFLALMFELPLKVKILRPFYFSLYKMQSNLDTDIDYNKNIVLDDEKNAAQITTQSRYQIIAK